jgi:hypothetical protein
MLEGEKRMKESDEASERRRSDPPSQNSFVELLRGVVPFLWFVLAAVAFVLFYPLAETAIKTETINKIKIGVIEVELSKVSVLPHNAVEIAKENVLIDESKRKRITDRFARMANETTGATILWVDNQHPYQNVTERRVFIAAGMTVDLARSTDDAIQWLSRSTYDVLLTDLDRSTLGDPVGKCFKGSEIANAGCALLNKIGACFQSNLSDRYCLDLRAHPNSHVPAMIVYASHLSPEWGTPSYAKGMTDRADELFELVLNALSTRVTRSSPEGPP